MPHDESSPLPESGRRMRLVLGGASLLALGFALNVDRIWAVEPEALDLPEQEPELVSQADGHRHRGEEGRMGTPSGAAFAVGGDDTDVWGGLTGTEVGEAYGVGGLGLVGTGRGGGGTAEGTIGLGNVGLIGKGGGSGGGSGYGRGSGAGFGGRGKTSRKTSRKTSPKRVDPRGGTYDHAPAHDGMADFIAVTQDPRSTFSIDVDTASYSAARRDLLVGTRPEAGSVRIEELINYFDYDYAPPSGDAPFSVTAEVGECPWNPEHELVHLGLQGKDIAVEDLPPRNLVFLVDASGSMSEPDKLPLVQYSLSRLAGTLRAQDRISLVVYAGAAGVVLPPTAGSEKSTIHRALDRLVAGGSTNGSAGIQEAYAQARAAFMEDGVNRVILASDGDFNVGVSSHEELIEMIERERKSGIELSVLGYGMGHRDETMEQLADKGNGNYAYIDSREEAHKVLVEQAGGTLVTIAKDVKIQVELDPARVLSYRLVGYENRRLAHRDFADDTKDAGEIGAGHSVTALYEVVPNPQAAASDTPWMTVQLRYKQPKGDTSTQASLPVVAEARALAETSDDFRFSAAVAGYGMLLRGSKLEGSASWASMQALAEGALGRDPSCRRHRFTDLVGMAGTLDGDPDVRSGTLRCESLDGPAELAQVEPPPSRDPYYDERPQVDADPPSEPFMLADVGPLVLEVLRLLPPLLALPLFFMALRRPRRRRQ